MSPLIQLARYTKGWSCARIVLFVLIVLVVALLCVMVVYKMGIIR